MVLFFNDSQLAMPRAPNRKKELVFNKSEVINVRTYTLKSFSFIPKYKMHN